MRWILVVLVAFLMPAVAIGQQKAKGKPAAVKSIQHGVGDRLVTTSPIVVAEDGFDSIELAKSFEAGDKEGIVEMMTNKTAIKLEAGLTLVVRGSLPLR